MEVIGAIVFMCYGGMLFKAVKENNLDMFGGNGVPSHPQGGSEEVLRSSRSRVVPGDADLSDDLKNHIIDAEK